MKALVVGGAGFIGSNLVDRLLASGFAVDVLDDLSTGSLRNLAEARADRSAELRIHQADVRSREVVELVARRAPDVVFHLAGGTDPEDCMVAGLRVVSGALAAGAGKVVVAVGPGSVAEEPSSEVDVMERAMLDLLRLHRERSGLDHTGLVLGSVYGPRQAPERGVVAGFAERLLAGEPCEVPAGSGGADFVFVDDVVDALVRAVERGGGLVLNVGTGRVTSMADVHRLMVDATGGDPATLPVIGPAGAAGDGIPLDPSRTKLHLGWSPWTSLEEGVAATLRWTAAGRVGRSGGENG